MRYLHCGLLLASLLSSVVVPAPLVAQSPNAAADDLFRRDNLMAWCIVPFDAKKRGPVERAAMLEKLGFKHFAYDYRGEHVPTFDAEIEALKKHGIALDAWWFPGSLNAEAKHILEVCKKHDVTPQLWITGGGAPTKTPEEQKARVVQEANRIRPIAEAAAAQGMKVGLYNHGGWFGEPENQLEIIAELKLPNVGIVYNQHHGHSQVDRFAEFLPKIIPHLLVLNLNGMNPSGDQRGQKIMQLGQGELDLKLLKIIRASGYRGPIGILGHTQDDAEARLHDNLDGLDWLLPQIDGKPAGEKPKMRTTVPGAKEPGAGGPAKPQAGGGAGGGYIAAGKNEYRTLPLTVELRATLNSKSGYNILVANDMKSSPAHWELFTMPGTGALTAYLSSATPDHVRTTVDLGDGKPHDVAMLYEAERVLLFVDGVQAADQKLVRKATPTGDRPAEKLAFLRVVEGNICCDGSLDFVRISRGLRPIQPKPATPNNVADYKVDDTTIGLWRFAADGKADAADLSKLANPAVRQTQAAASSSGGHSNKAPTPGPGVHLKPLDSALKVTLIDRSPDQVYMAVKVASGGDVYVGGREAVFVFRRNSDGTFRARQELFRFPKNSIIMGLEFGSDGLYVLTSNALYVIPLWDATFREHAKLRRILWGIPLDLHVSFHCMAWGQDGRLYITHGDPLLNYGDWSRPDHWGHWTYFSRPATLPLQGISPPDIAALYRDERPITWKKTPYTGQGSVLAFSPKSGEVSVVATGLRGPVGLAFDYDGNLFTNDNDHESRADQYAPAKLLHVLPGIDFGWPRGWMASKSPERFDLTEPMCDLGRGVPCDLTYYEHTYLPESVSGRLLQCRWDRHSVTGYKPTPRGISLVAKEETILQGDDNCRPVGIAVAAGGELYVTALYMTGNMAAPYCESDLVMVTRAADSAPPLPPDRIRGRPPFHREMKPVVGQGRSQRAIEAGATSTDDYARQLGVALIAREGNAERFATMLGASDEPTRLAGVLAVGRKLTVPAANELPPESLPLSYPKGNGWFHRDQQFYGSDAIVDLADFGRIGSYTMAERWKAVPHSADDEALFALLMTGLEDPSERVRLQAAYFLGLLKDKRSEPRIEAARREAIVAKLTTAPTTTIERVWHFGPLEQAKNYAAERGPIDLVASHDGMAWEQRPVGGTSAASGYGYFGIQSGTRQRALLTAGAEGSTQAWFNGLPAGERTASGWIVDLQPGGNEFLLRTANTSPPLRIELKAAGKIEAFLAEKLDSGLLAARLREAAAAGGSQPIPAEFLSLDWTKEAVAGNAIQGRKLFGTLACTKCHAIGPDQKAAGAPSLVGAKLRFTVPHLVESMLLPSRQVAEPFRAQTFTTDAGLTLTGLVVGETGDSIELLLPDASRRTLAVKEIEERKPTTLSPMPQGLVKTPSELRDLLAYLLSEKPTPP